MRKALIATVSAVAVIVGGFAATAGAQDDPGTIPEVAAATPDLSTLVTAVTEAGLVDTLSGPGPFTVFAPNNAAFEALPAGTLDSLLADPTGALTEVLQLHVVSGAALTSEQAIAAAGTNIDTLGGPVAVALDGDNLTVGGATVVGPDVEASNGIIHVIDSVIVEPASADEAPADAPQSSRPDPCRHRHRRRGCVLQRERPVVRAARRRRRHGHRFRLGRAGAQPSRGLIQLSAPGFGREHRSDA